MTDVRWPSSDSCHLRPWLLGSSMCSWCLFRWLIRLLLWRNVSPQTRQLKGFSFVWILTWTFKACLYRKRFPHMWQEKAFSPVWILLWTFREYLSFKLFPQMLHLQTLLSFSIMKSRSSRKAPSGSVQPLLFGLCCDITSASPSNSMYVPPCWSWGTRGIWERSCSQRDSASKGAFIEETLFSCHLSWLLHGSSCSSLTCSSLRLLLLSWFQSGWSSSKTPGGSRSARSHKAGF